jgi:phenylpyruvate tautomerase PptA (4-oxalocrotonate tautomerase family)
VHEFRATATEFTHPEETMPLYRCLVPGGSLDADTQDALAEAITTIHCSVTSLHPIFVSVVFTEYEPAAFYTGGRRNTLSVITAIIRAGHDVWTRGELLTRLSQSWLSITGQEARQISAISRPAISRPSPACGPTLT